MATYADMQNRIGDELGRAELIVGGASVARTKTAILDAIKGWKNYRFRFNELSTTLTTVAGTTDYTTATGLTDGIIEIDEMTIVYSGSRCRMDEVTASEYADMNASNPAHCLQWFALSDGRSNGVRVRRHERIKPGDSRCSVLLHMVRRHVEAVSSAERRLHNHDLLPRRNSPRAVV